MRSSFSPVAAACAAGLLFSLASMGQVSTAPPKVAVINFQKAVLDTAEIVKFSGDLNAKYRTRQDALQKAQQDLVDIQTQLNASQGKLSASGEADLQARGQRKQVQVKRMTDDIQEDFDGERDEGLRRATTRMREIIKKLVEEKGLDMVIDTAQGQVVVFMKPGFDLTDEAVAAYNKAYPVK
jgi:outer membrane protein